MAFTVTELITKAYALSGVVPLGLKTVSGSQIKTGLDLLNALLAVKSVNLSYIPYYTNYTFDSEAGKEKYTIPNLLSIETFVFYNQNVRFPMHYLSRDEYFATFRAQGITSLPETYHYERKLGGTDIFLYFLPNQAYPMEIWGKFALANVTLNQDLELILDQYYIEYLRYALAPEICGANSMSFTPRNEKRLAELEKSIFAVSPPDLTQQKISTLGRRRSSNIAAANLYTGWSP